MKTLRYLIVCLFPMLPAVWAQGIVSPAPLTVLVMPESPLGGDLVRPPSRVCVPPGEQVILMLPGLAGSAGDGMQWSRNGVPIPGATAGGLFISAAGMGDSGLYRVLPDSSPNTTYCGIALEVVTAGHLANSSSRLALKAGNDVQIFGFVVTGTVAKRLLIRAVGPSLAPMGVADYAALPKIRLFDAKGLPFGAAHSATVDWAGLFQRAGAFALTGNERLGVMCDVQTFPPGAYSVHVTDDAALGGTVLVEVYEP